MFSLTVIFGEAQNNTWSFLFKEKQTAQNFLDALQPRVGLDGTATVSDDFGQTATFNGKFIRAVDLEDIVQTYEANNQRMLIAARSQAKYDNLVMNDSDPELKKALQRMRSQEIQRRFMMGNGIGPGPVPSA